MVAMVPAGLAFFEVRKEFMFADTVEFKGAMLSEAPKGLDAVDVILAAVEFILAVVKAMVAKTAGHQPIVSLPAVDLNVAFGKGRFP